MCWAWDGVEVESEGVAGEGVVVAWVGRGVCEGREGLLAGVDGLVVDVGVDCCQLRGAVEMDFVVLCCSALRHARLSIRLRGALDRETSSLAPARRDVAGFMFEMMSDACRARGQKHGGSSPKLMACAPRCTTIDMDHEDRIGRFLSCGRVHS